MSAKISFIFGLKKKKQNHQYLTSQLKNNSLSKLLDILIGNAYPKKLPTHLLSRTLSNVRRHVTFEMNGFGNKQRRSQPNNIK